MVDREETWTYSQERCIESDWLNLHLSERTPWAQIEGEVAAETKTFHAQKSDSSHQHRAPKIIIGHINQA